MGDLKIGKIINILKINFRLILISTLSVTLVSAIVTFFFVSPKYEASSKVYIGKEKFKNVSTTYSNDEVTMYQKLIKTYGEIVKTKNLINKAIKKAGEDITVAEALSKIQAVAIADTQILQIKYTSSSREESYNMIYGLTEEFMKLSKSLYPNGNVHIIEQPKVPEDAVSPNKAMNIAIGAMLGMMLGIGIVFLKEYMNNSFSDKEEIEEFLQVSCLGSIPNFE
ncbi:YveK family protein [Clostridium disporicum]|uniref:Capsular polysaccharide biosynthesis protein n=1 Tax=Clostridium disporicum TaxID=84024 RepID=A0A174L650_9CLOT|nr:Wzz/FepE/Etk N-terminal domain-containing protein [Clostridium disporicum]CUP16880.1 capsular polysaccharide biosynthesis protein [Clostridium disporicum]